jgi:hypothetical protein
MFTNANSVDDFSEIIVCARAFESMQNKCIKADSCSSSVWIPLYVVLAAMMYA